MTSKKEFKDTKAAWPTVIFINSLIGSFYHNTYVNKFLKKRRSPRGVAMSRLSAGLFGRPDEIGLEIFTLLPMKFP